MAPRARRNWRKRPAPFSLRLSFEEREQLEKDAGRQSISAYIKAQLFDPDRPVKQARGLNPVKDQQALSQALALLGSSGLAQRLNELGDAAKWNVSLRQARFAPIISFETFKQIQDRLNGRPRAPVRKDISEDFPLRGFVLCDDCGKPLTACWSKGRTKRYPYYYCVSHGCDSRGKSIPRAQLEDGFEELLADAQPTRSLFDLAAAMFRDLWDQRLQRAAERKKAMKRQLSEVETQMESLVDRIVGTDNTRVIESYEKRLARLDSDKALLSEKLAKADKPGRTFEDGFRTAMGFLGNPQKIWRSDRFEDKRAVLRLTFADNLRYALEGGFRTANLSLPFSLLREFSAGN